MLEDLSMRLTYPQISLDGDAAGIRNVHASSRILFLGRDHSICCQLAAKFHWDLVTTSNAAEASVAVSGRDAVIIDLEDWSRQTAVHLLRDLTSAIDVIALAEESSHALIASLQELGVVHFVIKPFHASQILFSVQTVLQRASQRRLQTHEQREAGGSKFIGMSEFSRELRRQARLLSASNVPLHLTGESGAGKEVASLEFHEKSLRKSKAFLPVNCSTLGMLAESELFGHTRGAFTSAIRSTKGYVGTADGGTLFLDEIGDLCLEVQAKLLRFLDTGEYSRVGESAPQMADVRIITATNKDLWQLCLQGKFREDLYYRVAGAVFKVPPLRERREDIAPLIRHFLRQLEHKDNCVYIFAPDAIATLCIQEWPGNARQLRQVIHLVADKYKGREVHKQDIIRELEAFKPAGGLVTDMGSYKHAKGNALRAFDIAFFSNVIAASNGSLKKALALSGMHKKNYYEKLKELHLTRKQDDANDTA